MGDIAEALRKKYRTPQAALAALGLDESILKGSRNQKDNVMTKKVLSRFATASVAALGVYLQPKLAADAKLELNDFFDGVSKKNFAEKRAKIASDIKAKAKLAKDANLEDMHSFMDRLDKAEVAEGADEDPNSGLPMSKEDMDKKAKDEAEEAEKKKACDRKNARDAYLKGKGMSAEDIAALDAMEMEGEDGAEENAEGKEAEGAAKTVKDAEPVDKKAMDAAIKEAVKGTETRIRSEMCAASEAREFVRPWAGNLSMALDSAETIYRAALDAVGVKHTGLHPDSLKPILEAQPKPGEKRREHIAKDSAIGTGNSAGFESRWGASAGNA